MGEEKAIGDGVDRDKFLPCPACGLPCEIVSSHFVASEYYAGYLINTICILGHRFHGDVENVFAAIVRDWDNDVKGIPTID